MNWSVFASIGLSVHLLAGPVCTMAMAPAETHDSAARHAAHAVHTVPMSVDCDDCTEEPGTPENAASCEDGGCMTETSPAPSLAGGTDALLVAVLPAATEIALPSVQHTSRLLSNAGPPGTAGPFTIAVLRC